MLRNAYLLGRVAKKTRLEQPFRVLEACRGFAAQPDALGEASPDWTNPAAVLYKANDLRFEAHELPTEIARGHVRVAVRAVGICASDVHYLKKGRIGSNIVRQPMVIGHESAGEVASVGPEVEGLQVGDRVALEPGVPCWHNSYSRAGKYNLDPDIKFFATPPVHGSLARYVDHPWDFCFKLPDNVSYEEGAMVEPLSNGIQACRRGDVKPGKSVAILGAGPMGLNALACAMAHGAARVVITDVREDNLPTAERLGAWKVLHTPNTSDPLASAKLIRDLLPPYGPDVVIDCVGHQTTVQTALEAVARGGKIVQVGMGQDGCQFPILTVVQKELDYHGCYRYTNTYPLCIELISEGKIDVKTMISHRYGFSAEEVEAGFECAASPAQTKAIKVMFNLPGQTPEAKKGWWR